MFLSRYSSLAVLNAGLLLVGIFALSVGCSNGNPDIDTRELEGSNQNTAAQQADILSDAAAEATAIVQQAEATALVLQAEAQAAAIVKDASVIQPDLIDTESDRKEVPGETKEDAPRATPTADGSSPSTPSPADDPSIEVISVGFAGEGGFIHVQFMAPPGIARRWNQGLVSVTDEETGIAYVEIPVMPKIGPLIGKPHRAGQPGYVMLVNGPVPLPVGASVTVKLGDYVQEGVIVQG